MKKSLFLVALAAVSLASCSHDEVVELKSNEIKFSVVADKASRAATGQDQGIFCNAHLMPNFKLYAITEGEIYINGDEYTVNTDMTATNSANTRYWPATEVNFYATYNENNPVDLSGTVPTMKFTVNDMVDTQTDLVYATKIGEKRENEKTAAPVELNFRHALSQIVFQAKNINSKLHVIVKGVKVGQVANSGTLTFPTKSTGTNIVNHDQTLTQTTYQGTWNASESILTDYEVNITSTPLGTDETNLTNADAGTFDNALAMMLLPTQNVTFEDGSETVASKTIVAGQATQAWDPTSDEGKTAYNGTYLAVNCEIYNIAGDTYVGEDVQLYKGWAVIPAKFEWEQGKKYLYTFVFGDGNGGYEPIDPTPDPEGPDPVLVPMTFKVSVDDFQTGTVDPTENEMKTN